MSKDIFFCFWCYASQICLWSVATKIKVGYQPLAECSSCKGPRGERNGKALSGASKASAVANPSTPTKSRRLFGRLFFVLVDEFSLLSAAAAVRILLQDGDKEYR